MIAKISLGSLNCTGYSGHKICAGIVKDYPMPSSVIDSFKYDVAKKILKIVYVTGAVYNYLNVPISVYNALSKAKSKGTYLNKNIKGSFDYEKIYEP